MSNLAARIHEHLTRRRQVKHQLALAVALAYPCTSAVERRRRNTDALPALLPSPRSAVDPADYLTQRADAPL